MKKRFAAALIALMLLCAVPSLAVNYSLNYTFPEKITTHLLLNGYEAEGSVTVTGEDAEGPLSFLFGVLKNVNGCTFRLDGSGAKSKNDNCFSLTFSDGEEERLSFGYYRNGDQMLLDCSRLPDGTLRLGLSELPVLLCRLYELPELLTLPFYVRDTADRGISDTLRPYTEQLGLWLSDFCSVSSDANGSTLVYAVPADQLTTEAASLLESLLQDGEKASELEKWMEVSGAFEGIRKLGGLKILPQALRLMRPEGSVRVERTYNSFAEMKSTRIGMPLDPVSGYTGAEAVFTPGNAGENISVTVNSVNGDQFGITLFAEGDSVLKGEVLTCQDGERNAFAFEGSLEYGRLKDDPVQNKAYQDLTAHLDVSPTEGKGVHPVRFECVMHLESGRSKADKLLVQAEAFILDEQSGSRADIVFSGTTRQRTDFELQDVSRGIPAVSMSRDELLEILEGIRR